MVIGGHWSEASVKGWDLKILGLPFIIIVSVHLCVRASLSVCVRTRACAHIVWRSENCFAELIGLSPSRCQLQGSNSGPQVCATGAFIC